MMDIIDQRNGKLLTERQQIPDRITYIIVFQSKQSPGLS